MTMTIGARIYRWRKARGLPQSALAEAAGVTVSSVSLWESDRTGPRHDHLVAIVDRLGLTLEQFFGRIGARRWRGARLEAKEA
jgi:transcriptional regulator with XRE-family HTH domain